ADGLIAKGRHNHAVRHCDVICTTTDETLRCPSGGMIMMGRYFEYSFGIKLKIGPTRKMSSLMNSGIFPGNQGGPLEYIIAAKAVAFGEALTDEFLHYMVQVKKNMNVMRSEERRVGKEDRKQRGLKGGVKRKRREERTE